MREYVLSDAEHLYKIGLNGKKQLSLIAAKEERAVFSSVLTSHECKLFSADRTYCCGYCKYTYVYPLE